MVFPSRASAILPFANVSAMMPEPTTVATRASVPNHSANKRFWRLFLLIVISLYLIATGLIERAKSPIVFAVGFASKSMFMRTSISKNVL